MVKTILTVAELLSSRGKKVARLVGNRNISEVIIKSKKASLKKWGQLIPAIIVDAEIALTQGLDMVDADTGESITEENVGNYVALLDGNHRYTAHQKLKEEDKEYAREFYTVYSLNPEIAVVQTLAEINVATNPWKGGDYGKGAKMVNQDRDLPLLDAINELVSKGYSLEAASKWYLFKSLDRSVLVRAMGKDIDPKLENVSGIDRGNRLLEAARKAFSDKTLGTRTLVDWVISHYDGTADENKASIVNHIVEFFQSLSRPQAEEIEKAKGQKGISTKEDVIYEKLNKLFSEHQS